MDLFTIDNKAQLLEHKLAIAALFQECFANKLTVDLWQWAYIDNPHGEPLVTLCYEGNQLTGHCASAPLPTALGATRFNSHLAMTAMVAKQCRGQGLYPRLVNENEQAALQRGVDFVFGFPNPVSTPVYRDKTRWVFPELDYVACISKQQLVNSDLLARINLNDHYVLDLRDDTTRAWRSSRPGACYCWKGNVLYKEFNHAIDVLYYDSASDFSVLPDEKNINILLHGDDKQFYQYKIFDYQFGGVSLCKEFKPTLFNRQMCLSDVF